MGSFSVLIILYFAPGTFVRSWDSGDFRCGAVMKTLGKGGWEWWGDGGGGGR